MDIQITIPGHGKKALRRFRDTNGFESFDAYVESTLIPFILDNVPEARQIRCSISGWLVGYYTSEETEATIRQGVVALNLRRFNPILDSFTTAEFVDAIEMLIDHVVTRVLILSRPSPIFTGAIGKQAMDSAPRTRQLISLLNQLIFDNGGFRAKTRDSFELVENLRQAARLADQIRFGWNGELDSEAEDANQYQDLYSGLVELDAKWHIRSLRLTEKEEKALEEIRKAAPKFDVNRVRHFVWSMVVLRDKHYELNFDDKANSWTRNAYIELMKSGYDSAARVASGKSNLIKGEKVGGAPTRPSGSTGPKTAKTPKPSKSKNPNVGMFAAMFADMKGFDNK